MFELPDKHQGPGEPWFPDPQNADEEGLLSIGGSLAPNWLLHAYYNGIFPWYSQGQPILWWSPDPRMVVAPEQVHISKSMRQFMRKTSLKGWGVRWSARYTGRLCRVIPASPLCWSFP